MRRFVRGLIPSAVGLAVVLGNPTPSAAQDKGRPNRVGRVILEGNVAVDDALILAWLDLRPGQILRYPAIDTAARNIALLGVFDPAAPPEVLVLPTENDTEFSDIRVRVREQSGDPSRLAIRAYVAHYGLRAADFCRSFVTRLYDITHPRPAGR